MWENVSEEVDWCLCRKNVTAKEVLQTNNDQHTIMVTHTETRMCPMLSLPSYHVSESRNTVLILQSLLVVEELKLMIQLFNFQSIFNVKAWCRLVLLVIVTVNIVTPEYNGMCHTVFSSLCMWDTQQETLLFMIQFSLLHISSHILKVSFIPKRNGLNRFLFSHSTFESMRFNCVSLICFNLLILDFLDPNTSLSQQ